MSFKVTFRGITVLLFTKKRLLVPNTITELLCSHMIFIKKSPHGNGETFSHTFLFKQQDSENHHADTDILMPTECHFFRTKPSKRIDHCRNK